MESNIFIRGSVTYCSRVKTAGCLTSLLLPHPMREHNGQTRGQVDRRVIYKALMLQGTAEHQPPHSHLDPPGLPCFRHELPASTTDLTYNDPFFRIRLDGHLDLQNLPQTPAADNTCLVLLLNYCLVLLLNYFSSVVTELLL